jgi:hypothetical protein
MFEEEGTWFPQLKAKASAADQARITERFAEEFDRYMGVDAGSDGAIEEERRSFRDYPEEPQSYAQYD